MLARQVEDEILVLCPHVAATVIDGGAVLLDLETKYFYRLNSSGWAVSQMLENGASLPQVLEQCRRWGADEKGLADAQALLDTLVQGSLATYAGSASPGPAPQLEGRWVSPSIERQSQPLHRLVSSAFDPSIPLAE